MIREKVFVVTLVTKGGKTDFGINFLTEVFTNMIMALNKHRKSYEAYASEVLGEDRKKIEAIVAARSGKP